MMRHLVSLTNIPTPYRIHFYEALACSLETVGVSFTVIFMATTEPGRHWVFDAREWSFEYRFPPGLHPVVGGHMLHLNPGGLIELVIRPPTWLILSGSWYFPTVFLSSWLAKLARTRTLFWSESNLAYVEHRSYLAQRLRSWVMNSFDGYIVPGGWAREYVLHHAASAPRKPMLDLPNVVDERLFRDRVAERRKHRQELLSKWHLEQGRRPILFVAARLEPIKGIRELLMTLASMQARPVTLLIAGEGALRAELETLIRDARLEDRVRLLGYLREPEILDLLSLADGFILPSLGDPYPLAVIEAAFAGLPLLLSDRVGCHPEALLPGQNGLLFDPHDPSSIQFCLKRFVALGSEEWTEMGLRSLEVAEERFSTGRVVARFLDELLSL
jgi:glycosyltransferase involved in cell wall biosynthesis